MPLFPKIDQPCPLGIDAQRRIAGWCTHCSKSVHALDAMSDAERIAVLRDAGGPVCVSYRLPMRRGVAAGLGAAALALAMAGPAHAADAPFVPAGEAQAGTTVPSLQSTEAPASPRALDNDKPGMEMITLGGVSDPANAEWSDTDDVPELPMIDAAPRRR